MSCQPGLTWLTHYIRNEIGIKKLFFKKKMTEKKKTKVKSIKKKLREKIRVYPG